MIRSFLDQKHFICLRLSSFDLRLSAIADLYAYDSLSRKVEETQQVGASATVQVVTCGYDIEAGNAVEQPTELIYPDGRVVESTYDELNRLLTKTDQGQSSSIATYRYIGLSRVAKMEFQNGTRLAHLEEDSNGNIFDPDLQKPIVDRR